MLLPMKKHCLCWHHLPLFSITRNRSVVHTNPHLAQALAQQEQLVKLAAEGRVVTVYLVHLQIGGERFGQVLVDGGGVELHMAGQFVCMTPEPGDDVVHVLLAVTVLIHCGHKTSYICCVCKVKKKCDTSPRRSETNYFLRTREGATKLHDKYFGRTGRNAYLCAAFGKRLLEWWNR